MRLFDVPDRPVDGSLFQAFASLRGESFNPWMKALEETGLPPMPDHVKAVEILPALGTRQDELVVGHHPPILVVASEGSVDHPFWCGVETFHQIIQAVFSSCPPANRTADVPSAGRLRFSEEIHVCRESLEEFLGMESPDAEMPWPKT